MSYFGRLSVLFYCGVLATSVCLFLTLRWQKHKAPQVSSKPLDSHVQRGDRCIISHVEVITTVVSGPYPTVNTIVEHDTTYYEDRPTCLYHTMFGDKR